MAQDFALQFKRQYADSLDTDYRMTTAERTAYLSSPLRYGGQPVFDTTEGKTYYLSEDRTTWIPYGGSTSTTGITMSPQRLIGRGNGEGLGPAEEIEAGAALYIADNKLNMGFLYTGDTTFGGAAFPKASFLRSYALNTGYLIIKLPFTAPDFHVTIRGRMQEVNTGVTQKGRLMDFYVAGQVETTGRWQSVSAYILTTDPERDLPVRYVKATDGTYAVYIGEYSTQWTNCSIVITEVTFSRNGATLEQALSPWTMSFAGSVDGEIQQSRYNNMPYAKTQVLDYADLENIPLVFPPEAHTHSAEEIEGLYAPMDLTYAELQTLIAASGMTVGQRYLITDYSTKHIVPNTTTVNSAPVEPIIVEAASPSVLAPRVISTVHPTDIIEYDVSLDTISQGSKANVDYPYVMDNIAAIGYDYIEFTQDIITGQTISYLTISWGSWAGNITFSNQLMLAETSEYKVVGNRFYVKAAAAAGFGTVEEVYGDIWLGTITAKTGEIIYRKSQTGLETYYDWRNVKFRRWFVDATLHVSGTTYAVGDLRKNASNEVFRCIKAGVYPLTDETAWTRLHVAGYYAHTSSTYAAPALGTVVATNFKDFYTFHAPDNTTPGVARNISIDKADVLNNIVFEMGTSDQCRDIKIGGSSKDNTFSANGAHHEFYNVILPSYTTNNVLIGTFRNVMASVQFKNNVSTVDIFENNTLNHFTGNIIQAKQYFTENNFNICKSVKFYGETYNNSFVNEVTSTEFTSDLLFSVFNTRVANSAFNKSVQYLSVTADLYRVTFDTVINRSAVNKPLSSLILSIPFTDIVHVLADSTAVISMSFDDAGNLTTSKIVTTPQ